jgi:hypothetical protein
MIEGFHSDSITAVADAVRTRSNRERRVIARRARALIYQQIAPRLAAL